MNKKVILCEGRNDSVFLETLLKKMKYYEEPSVFNRAKGKTEETKNLQTRKINGFLDLNSPYYKNNFFIKSEGGKDMVYACILPLISKLARFKLIVLLDADSKKPEEVIEEKIKNEIESRYEGSGFKIKYELEDRTDEASLYVIKKIKENQELSEFHAIFFKESLEDAAGIDDEDSDNEKLEKIKRYASSSNIDKLFSKVLAQ